MTKEKLKAFNEDFRDLNSAMEITLEEILNYINNLEIENEQLKQNIQSFKIN